MNFKEVCRRIKELKIQGAENIAIAGIKAIGLRGFSARKIFGLRPTEPALHNGIKFAERFGIAESLRHFEDAKREYTKYCARIVPKKGIVFTHCHSSSVIEVLKTAHDSGKKFEVYNTETRPLYQGRKTSVELLNYGIKVTEFIDAAGDEALEKSNVMLIGADAILKKGDVINKIGSEMFARVAHELKVPVYIITDSWKFSGKHVKLEERDFHEVWKNAPRKLKIRDPGFELVRAKYITGIISELGILKPNEFVKAVKREYKWI